MIYLDAAALVKLVRAEAETAALRLWLRQHRTLPRITSVLSEIEVARAVRRAAPNRVRDVGRLMRQLDRVELTEPICRRAAKYDDVHLRSLDAIHLATAQEAARVEATALTAFVTYDQRLLDAAKALDLRVVAPAGD